MRHYKIRGSYCAYVFAVNHDDQERHDDLKSPDPQKNHLIPVNVVTDHFDDIFPVPDEIGQLSSAERPAAIVNYLTPILKNRFPEIARPSFSLYIDNFIHINGNRKALQYSLISAKPLII